MRPRSILFDLDGTLIDHFAAIHRTHAHTLRHFGLPEPSYLQVRRAVGGGIEDAISSLIGAEHIAKVPEAIKVFRAFWATTMLDDVVLLPGALPILQALRGKGIRTGVLTNKHGPSSREICAHLRIDSLLDVNIGATDTPWLKPDERLTRHALDELKASAKETLFVGDSPFDVETAQKGGLECWCVTTGTHTADELTAAGAKRIFVGLPQLQESLQT